MAETVSRNQGCAEESNDATSKVFRPTLRFVDALSTGDILAAKEGSVRYAPGVKEENLKPLREKFKTLPGDIFICAFPKSGTTWTQQIVKLVLNNATDDGRDIEEHTPWVDVMKIEEVEAMKSPRGFKSHFPFQCKLGEDLEHSRAKYIYIYRNPKDTLVSYFHFNTGFAPYYAWEGFFNRFLNGQNIYGSHVDHVLGWWEHRDAPNVLILNYETMHKDLEGEVKRIADFLEKDLSPEQISSIAEQTKFSSMKTNPAANMAWTDAYRADKTNTFMRKGKIGDWKNHFTEEQSAKLDALYAKKLQGTGLTFDYGDEVA